MKCGSSRERMLAALRCQEPDHVPLLFKPFGFKPPARLRWSNQVEQAQRWLSLELDAWLDVFAPTAFHPDVTIRQWEERVPGELWPCMIKEYHTPAGVLRQEVFKTEDWDSPHWPAHAVGGVELFDDCNVPRYRKCMIETEADLAKLKYLFHPPSAEAIAQFREGAAALARQAAELGVVLVGNGPNGVDAAIWVCGVTPAVLMSMDQPEMFQALMEIIHEQDRRTTAMLLETPVDLIMRRGYYEGTSFWSPDLHRRFFMPRVRDLANVVHQGGRLLGYTMSVGYMPLLTSFPEMGCDVHFLLDPLPDGERVDLHRVKSAYSGRTAVLGGLNAPITLERGTREQIRQEVFDSVAALGPGGGLALTAAEAIFATTPWKSITAAIAAWKEVRDYPLARA